MMCAQCNHFFNILDPNKLPLCQSLIRDYKASPSLALVSPSHLPGEDTASISPNTTLKNACVKSDKPPLMVLHI